MSKVRAHNISVSVDGYMAGPNQGPEQPLGEGGMALHEWAFATKAFSDAHDGEFDGAASDSPDERFVARGNKGVGATILGRNMFGPIRGPWENEDWQGWWGPNPPYHHDTFVLTHHPRPSLEMEGGTVFHFVDDPQVAMDRAKQAAGGRDVQIGGGASTIQQYLRAGQIDELHIAIVPILLGSGERLFDHLDGGPKGMRVAEFVSSPAATHVRFVRD